MTISMLGNLSANNCYESTKSCVFMELECKYFFVYVQLLLSAKMHCE